MKLLPYVLAANALLAALLTLVGLKAFGVLLLSWLWVLAPLWAPFALSVLLALCIYFGSRRQLS